MHPYISGGWHAAVSYYSMAQCWLSTKSPIIITQSLLVMSPAYMTTVFCTLQPLM